LLLLLALAFLPLKASAQKGILDEEPAAAQWVFYLPTTYIGAGFVPDLVVESITVNSDSAIVVIKNQGVGHVEPTTPFWVDLYVDPKPMPKGPNDVWDRFCTQGLVWAVRLDDGRTLKAGETLTMTYCHGQENQDSYYWPKLSSFDGQLDPGTTIAVQVDSANTDTTYGAVLEMHDVYSTTYNNISSAVSIAGSGCGIVQPEQPDRLLPLALADRLPLRPQRAE